MGQWLKISAFGLAGAVSGLSGAAIGEFVLSIDGTRSAISLIGSTACWFGSIGFCIALGILLAQDWYLRRQVSPPRLVVGVLAGTATAMASGAMSQSIYTTDPSEAWRVFCWGIAGGLLGFGISCHLPNVVPWRGALGGAIGGWAGGGAFVAINNGLFGNTMARLVGVTLIGSFVGGMLAVAETLLRGTWLEIRFPDGSCRRLNLGGAPGSIGSDRRRATVFVAGLPGVALRYRVAGRAPLREDAVRRTTAPATLDVPERVGPVSVTVRARR